MFRILRGLRHLMRVNARDARARRAAHVGVRHPSLSGRLRKPVAGISEKLACLMKSNFYALL